MYWSKSAWPHGAFVQENTLDAYIARLRRKLSELPDAPADRHRPRRRVSHAMSRERARAVLADVQSALLLAVVVAVAAALALTTLGFNLLLWRGLSTTPTRWSRSRAAVEASALNVVNGRVAPSGCPTGGPRKRSMDVRRRPADRRAQVSRALDRAGAERRDDAVAHHRRAASSASACSPCRPSSKGKQVAVGRRRRLDDALPDHEADRPVRSGLWPRRCSSSSPL